MKTIYKYRLHTYDCVIEIPDGGCVLSAGYTQNTLVIWALVDTNSTPTSRRFVCINTGSGMDDYAKYSLSFIDTVMVGSHLNPILWHIFEVT